MISFISLFEIISVVILDPKTFLWVAASVAGAAGCNWIFENFILVDEAFAKNLRILEAYVLVNNNLCGKLFSSLESPTAFDQSFKVTSVLCSILDFNLLSYELTLCLTLFTAVENIVKNKTFIVCAFQPDRHDEYWSCKFS